MNPRTYIDGAGRLISPRTCGICQRQKFVATGMDSRRGKPTSLAVCLYCDRAVCKYCHFSDAPGDSTVCQNCGAPFDDGAQT